MLSFFCGLSIDFLVGVALFSISRNGVKVSHLSKRSEVLFGQWYPTLCYPMDCSLPGSSLHGILQDRTLEWVAIPFSRGSSQPRDPTQVSCTAGGFFTISKKTSEGALLVGDSGADVEGGPCMIRHGVF